MKIMPLKDFVLPEEFPDFKKDWNRIADIIHEVRMKGDEALKKFTRVFDGVETASFSVELPLQEEASARIDSVFRKAVQEASDRIKKIARLQKKSFRDCEWEIEPGVWAEQKVIPVKRAGIYVPGGRYPLISSLLMGCIPAREAGVEEISVCIPPGPEGRMDPALMYAAGIAGADRLYRVGGAQAIAALAYGTETIPAVDMIAGPGNIYVNIAKKMVYGQVGIDFVAGPTEILIIAEKGAEPDWVAADLLAQAEHDEKARAVMITDSPEMAEAVKDRITEQIKKLKTRETANRAWEQYGIILIADSLDQAAAAADKMAPEHLQLHVNDPEAWRNRFNNYGTLFLGSYACEVLGDYSSGLNHILPTNRVSRYCGGLSVRNFLKTQTVLNVNEKGFRKIAPVAECLAKAEGLDGHAKAVGIRFREKSLNF